MVTPSFCYAPLPFSSSLPILWMGFSVPINHVPCTAPVATTLCYKTTFPAPLLPSSIKVVIYRCTSMEWIRYLSCNILLSNYSIGIKWEGEQRPSHWQHQLLGIALSVLDFIHALLIKITNLHYHFEYGLSSVFPIWEGKIKPCYLNVPFYYKWNLFSLRINRHLYVFMESLIFLSFLIFLLTHSIFWLLIKCLWTIKTSTFFYWILKYHFNTSLKSFSFVYFYLVIEIQIFLTVSHQILIWFLLLN